MTPQPEQDKALQAALLKPTRSDYEVVRDSRDFWRRACVLLAVIGAAGWVTTVTLVKLWP